MVVYPIWACIAASLLPILMMCTSRACGGGFYGPYIGDRFNEVIFALPIGFTVYLSSGSVIQAILGWAITFGAMALGHGTFFAMNGYEDKNRDDPNDVRIQTIEKVFRPLYVKLGGDIYKPMYSWYMMGCKGLLIGLPLGLWAIPLAILWPTCYWVGRKVEHNINEVAEYASGVCAACMVMASLLYPLNITIPFLPF